MSNTSSFIRGERQRRPLGTLGGMDQIESLISKAVQMREQHVAEIGSGRRKWPRSITERVLKLGAANKAKVAIAGRTARSSYDNSRLSVWISSITVTR